jgi:hypothetical protein
MSHTLVVLVNRIGGRSDAKAPAAGPTAGRGHLRPMMRLGLLASIASAAFLAGMTLAFVAVDLRIANDVPLWNAALVGAMLTVLALVVSCPEWWAPPSAPGRDHSGCCDNRTRRASHPVDLRRGRSSRARPRPDGPGVHPSPRRWAADSLGGLIPSGSQAKWLVDAHRRDSMLRLARRHGRLRG